MKIPTSKVHLKIKIKNKIENNKRKMDRIDYRLFNPILKTFYLKLVINASNKTAREHSNDVHKIVDFAYQNVQQLILLIKLG